MTSLSETTLQTLNL